MKWGRYMRVVILCSLCGSLGAQNINSVKGDESKQAGISIIAVGAKPARSYTDSGAMKLPQRGEVPPTQLYYRANEEGSGSKVRSKKDQWQAIELTFNNSSVMTAMPAGRQLTFYQKGTSDYKKYLTLSALEEGERRVVLLTRSTSKDASWMSAPDQHEIGVAPSSAQQWEGVQLVFKNLSSGRLVCGVGNSKKPLTRQKTLYYRDQDEGLCRVVVHSEGDARAVYHTAIRIKGALGAEAGARPFLYVFYDADPKTNAGSKVGVFRMVMPYLRSKQQGDGSAVKAKNPSKPHGE